MAAYPCSIGPHRYGGAQRSAYISDVTTARPVTHKLRLCPRHFGDLEVVARAGMELLEEDVETQMSMLCSYDGCMAGRDMSVFLKLYPGGEDYRQYAGDYCAEHGRALLGELRWGEGVEM